MKQTITLIVAWFVACTALCLMMIKLQLHWNYSTWSPKWDIEAFFYVLGVAVALIAIWFLARVTRGRISLVVAIIVCLVLVTFGFVLFFPEPTSLWNDLGRKQPSPLWYRGGRLLSCCLPGVYMYLQAIFREANLRRRIIKGILIPLTSCIGVIILLCVIGIYSLKYVMSHMLPY